MSCLTLAPSALCASGIDSRRCHIAFACSRLVAIAVSSIRPRSSADAEQRLERRGSRALSLSASECSISTVQGAGRERLAQLRRSGVRTSSSENVVHHLEAGQPGPERARGRARAASIAASSVGSVASAVSVAAGRGCSFSVAAVMIAERAFAADQQVAQVVAGVVLAQRREAVPDLALGGHDLEAEAQLARVAVAQHLRAAGVGGEVAADRAAALGGQAEREQQAVRRRPPPARAAARSRPRRRASGWPRRRCGCGSAAPVDSSTCAPLASGTEPPTRPVLPPWVTMRRAVRATGRDDRRDLGGASRAERRRARGRWKRLRQSIS